MKMLQLLLQSQSFPGMKLTTLATLILRCSCKFHFRWMVAYFEGFFLNCPHQNFSIS